VTVTVGRTPKRKLTQDDVDRGLRAAIQHISRLSPLVARGATNAEILGALRDLPTGMSSTPGEAPRVYKGGAAPFIAFSAPGLFLPHNLAAIRKIAEKSPDHCVILHGARLAQAVRVALGIPEPQPSGSAGGERHVALARTTCHECGKDVALRKGGLLREHAPERRGARLSGSWCAGSGTRARPATSSRERPLTTAETNQLARLGWSSRQIRLMSPGEARDLIERGERKKPGPQTEAAVGDVGQSTKAEREEYRKALIKVGVGFEAPAGSLEKICEALAATPDSDKKKHLPDLVRVGCFAITNGIFRDEAGRDVLVVLGDARVLGGVNAALHLLERDRAVGGYVRPLRAEITRTLHRYEGCDGCRECRS
jgi:hypothetical protein